MVAERFYRATAHVDGLDRDLTPELVKVIKKQFTAGMKVVHETAIEMAPSLKQRRTVPRWYSGPVPRPNALKRVIKQKVESLPVPPGTQGMASVDAIFVGRISVNEAGRLVGGHYERFVMYGTGEGHIKTKGLEWSSDPRKSWVVPGLGAQYNINNAKQMIVTPSIKGRAFKKRGPSGEVQRGYRVFWVGSPVGDPNEPETVPVGFRIPGQKANPFVHRAFKKHMKMLNHDMQKALAKKLHTAMRNVKFRIDVRVGRVST